MNQGRRGESVFPGEEDGDAFMQVVRDTVEVWNLQVAAYCLMSSHYHLLVQTPDGNLSRCMRHINGLYTQRFNKTHHKDGPLFRGRYKAVLIENDRHLLEVMRYLHRDPLRAGIVERLADYPWSSHHAYLSSAPKWSWLRKDFLLAMLATRKSRRPAAYLDFMSRDEPEEIERFYSMKKLPSVLGDPAFKEWVKENFQHLGAQKEVPESRMLALDPEEVIFLVCSLFKIDRQHLMAARRGRENLPRDVAVYLSRRHCRKTLTEIGGYFGMSNYSTVSSAVERIKVKKNNNPALSKRIDAIAYRILKSQKRRQP